MAARERKEDDEGRRYGGNALQKSIYILEDPEKKFFFQRAKVETLSSWLAWRGDHAQACKTVQGCRDWYIGQLSGGWVAQQTKALQVLNNFRALKAMDIHTTPPSFNDKWHPEVKRQDSRAGLVGKMVVKLHFRRAKRWLQWMVWPGRSVLFADPNLRDGCMALLKRDHDNFLSLKAHPDLHCGMLAKRSIFQWTCVQQLVQVCDRMGFKFDEHNAECRERMWLQCRARMTIGTLVNEVAFKYMRAAEPLHKNMSATSKWVSVLDSPLVDGDFSFKHVDVAPCTSGRSEKLPDDLFLPQFRKADEDLREVASRVQHTEWPSTSSTLFPEIFMDLLAMRFVREALDSQWPLLENMWKTCVMNIEGIVVRIAAEDTMYLPLGTVGCSGALAMKLSEERLQHRDDPNDVIEVFTPQATLEEVTTLHVHSIGEWIGQTVEWRSPHFVYMDRGAVFAEPPPMQPDDYIGIVLVATHAAELLLAACARRAFGNLELSILRKFCMFLEISLRDTSGCLYGVLEKMIKHFLPDLSEEEVLAILMLRLAPAIPVYAEIMEIPEAADLVDQEALEATTAAAEQIETEKKELKSSAKRYWVARRASDDRRSAASGVAPGGPPRVWDGPRCELEQAFVKGMMPPNGHIWRDNSGGAWCIHQPPYYRRCRWAAFGGVEAATEAVRIAWRIWLAQAGRPLNYCPVAGLFDEAAGPALAVAGG